MNKETKAEAKNIRTSTQTSGTSRASPTSKRYDEALKKAAVENWIPSGQPGTVIAAELGVSYPSRKDWKARDCGDAIPQRDPLAAENRALRRELARVREPQDILKKRGHLQRTGEQRYETIEAMKKEHSLRQLWAAFEVKRCGYLIWGNAPASDRERTDALLMGPSEAGHEQHKGRYGVPRIADELADQGPRHGVKRIARLMKSAGIPGLRPKRFVPQTTDSNHDQPIAPNLLSQAPAPTRPNPTWVTDLTYVSLM